jgi:alpha-beta hydrolase superfamily lysophospholipase
MKTTTGTRAGRPSKSSAVRQHTVIWEPDGEPVADVFLVHGYAEHSGRYTHVAEYLCGRGLRVLALDHRGHGQTTGVAFGMVDDFDLLVDDTAAFISDERGDRPTFVYGHSMGGLAAVRLAERSGMNLAGVIVASAALVPAESIPTVLVKLVNVIGKVAPSLPTIQLEGAAISRRAEVVETYENDPLNYRGKIPANTGRQMNLAMHAGMEAAPSIKAPLLIIHGGEDRLTEVSGAHLLAESVGSADTTVRIWDGAYHELHNEPEREDVLNEVATWVLAHSNG